MLLCCARTLPEVETQARIERLLLAEPDWELLWRMGQRHGMLPLLYRHLSTVNNDAVPQAFQSQLRAYYRNSAVRNHYLTGELLRILKLFESQGIPAIPLKGPALAARIYGDVVLRQFDDLDILIRKPDYQRARNLLLADDYELKLCLPDERETVFQRHSYHHSFSRVSDGSLVELHWGFAPSSFAFPFEKMRIWECVSSLNLHGAPVPIPATEDLLILLCVHGARHLWNRLKWICDVAELLRASPVDWERALRRAAEMRSTRMLLLGLRLAQKLLGAPLPESVALQAQADRIISTMVAQVRRVLDPDAESPPRLPVRNLFHLRSQERLRDKLRYGLFFCTIPGTSEWGLLSLPPQCSFIYYVIRPLRVVRMYWAELAYDLRRSHRISNESQSVLPGSLQADERL